VLRASEALAGDPRLGAQPSSEMSTDGPDTSTWWMTD
jgi:hypothetical protein